MKSPDAKRSRACDSCRGLKVKCDFGDKYTPGEPCKRCAKARRQCIVTPATRRRQKKADSRVAELERKVDALTQRLADQRAAGVDEGLKRSSARSVSPYHTSSQHYPTEQQALGEGYGSPGKRRRIEPAISHVADNPDEQHGRTAAPSIKSEREQSNVRLTGIYNETKAPVFDHSDIDQRISRIIDAATAERIFDRYVTKFVPRFPAVVFPPGTKAKTVRKAKPIVFLAILSSTCYGTSVPKQTQDKLEEEFRDVISDSVWKKGEKSLEIIQSLHVATLWYRPPSNFEQHMFYQWVHFSAFMAIDIGIGKRLPPTKRKLFEQPWARAAKLANPESAVVRRAWITCYFLCTSISMILRRPILFRFTQYTRECLEYLESAEDALPSDKLLCQHVRLAHIAEDIAVQFALDDPAVNLSISDRTVTYNIKHLEKDLAEVVEKHLTDHSIKLSEHITSLYLHEIALHSQSNVEDFKAPFTEESFRTSAGQAVLGPEHVEALTACKAACRNILDTFLSYEQDTVYILPVIFCMFSTTRSDCLTLTCCLAVRCIYAVVVLIKLYIAAKSPGEMCNIIKTDDLGVESYIERMYNLFKSFMERDSNSPHSKFLYVMERLQIRFTELQRGEDAVNGRGKPTLAQIAAGAQGSTPVTPSTAQAQGLHLLSEAAMSGTQPAPVAAPPQQQQPPPPQQQQQQQQPHHAPGQPPQSWYAHPQPGDMAAAAAAAAAAASAPQLGLDPHGYGAYAPDGMAAAASAAAGFDGDFDFGLGGLGMAGMGMDGAISGLFMADGLWTYHQPDGPPPGQVYPGPGAGWS